MPLASGTAGAEGSARPQGPVSLAVSWSGSLAVWSRGSVAFSDSSALSLGTTGDRNLQQSVEVLSSWPGVLHCSSLDQSPEPGNGSSSGQTWFS